MVKVLTLSSLKAVDEKETTRVFNKEISKTCYSSTVFIIFFWEYFILILIYQEHQNWFQSIKISPFFLDALYSGGVGAFIYGDNRYNPVLWTMQIELLGSFIIYFTCYLHNNRIFKYMFLLLSVVLSAQISGIAFLGIISLYTWLFFILI